jgi:hypothetical protein
LIEWLRGSEDEVARRLCKIADTLTFAEMLFVPIEAICINAGVPTKKFLGLLMEEVSEQATMSAQLLSKAAHPRVVRATVEAAMLPENSGDRKMLHLAEGFVPVPKTQVTYLNRPQIDARQQAVNVMLPPVEASVRRISERFLSAPVANVPVEVLPEPEDPGSEID